MDSPDLSREHDDRESGNNGSETGGKQSRCVILFTVCSKGVDWKRAME